LPRRSGIVAKAGELFDRVSKRSGVVSNPRISRHDGHQLWRLAEQFRGGKMHRIERANRFYGKGATNTREHCVGDGDNEATTCEDSQPSHGSALLRGRQATAGSSPDDRSCGFRERQRRRHLPSFSAQRLQSRRVAFQERRKQNA
jgi:hypothetical protein